VRLAVAVALLAFLLASELTAGCSNTTRSGILDDAGGPTFGDAASAPPSGSSGPCSSDLHSVIDEQGNVVKTCPPAQGCTPTGDCAPACEAAKANKSTIGCDYYSVDPDTTTGNSGGCFAGFVANTWNAPVTLTVDRGGVSYSITKIARVPVGEREGHRLCAASERTAASRRGGSLVPRGQRRHRVALSDPSGV